MNVSQIWTVTELVARRMGISIDPALATRQARQQVEPPRTPEAIADALTRAAGGLQFTYLRRSLDADGLAALAQDEALPVVLLAHRPSADVWLAFGRETGVLSLTRVAADGSTELLRVDPLVWFAEAGSRVEALVPVPVSSSVAPDDFAAATPLSRLVTLLSRETGDIWVIYFYATLTGIFSLALPLGVQAIVQLVSSGQLLQPVSILIVFVVAGTLVTGVLQLLQLHVVEILQRRIFARLAFEFTFRIPRMRLEALHSLDLSEMMNRFFETITIQKALAKLLTESTTALLQVLFGLLLLTFYHPYFTVFGISLLALLYLVFRFTGAKGLATSIQESKYKYRVAHWLEEMARTVRTLKFGGRSTLTVQRMDGEIANYLKYRKKHFEILVQQSIAIIAIKTLITGGLLVLGTLLVIDRQISLGQFVASEIVVITVLSGLEKLLLGLSSVYDILTSVDKAGNVSDIPVEPSSGLSLPEPPTPIGMHVELRDLSYVYASNPRPALSHITLDCAPGTTTVLTGFDGAGQTTVLKIVAGMFDRHLGAVLYDGLSARDLEHSDLRSRIGMVLEHNELFDGTVEENITLGRTGVGLADVLRALDAVGIREQVVTLPQGLQTLITGGGQLLPATVQRKLMIARAIAGRPRLLVVDDVLQHFDTASKRQIIEVLTATKNGWTVIAASHDPAFLAMADQVAVLEEGALRSRGSFADLLQDPYAAAIISTGGTVPAGVA